MSERRSPFGWWLWERRSQWIRLRKWVANRRCYFTGHRMDPERIDMALRQHGLEQCVECGKISAFQNFTRGLEA
jgi:hypothetical protein